VCCFFLFKVCVGVWWVCSCEPGHQLPFGAMYIARRCSCCAVCRSQRWWSSTSTAPLILLPDSFRQILMPLNALRESFPPPITATTRGCCSAIKSMHFDVPLPLSSSRWCVLPPHTPTGAPLPLRRWRVPPPPPISYLPTLRSLSNRSWYSSGG
jgi:hypothetical protein